MCISVVYTYACLYVFCVWHTYACACYVPDSVTANQMQICRKVHSYTSHAHAVSYVSDSYTEICR